MRAIVGVLIVKYAFVSIVTTLLFWKDAKAIELCLILSLMGFIRGVMEYLGFSKNEALISSGIIAILVAASVHAVIRKFGG